MTWSRILAVAGVIFAVVIAAWWWTQSSGSGEAALRIDPDDAELVSLGQRIYAQECASCHGAGLEGQANWRNRKADGRMPAPPHDATGHTWHHDDATLFTVTKYGPQAIAGPDYRSDMPAYEGALSDRDIRAVLAFIKSTWPDEVRTRQAQISKQTRGAGS